MGTKGWRSAVSLCGMAAGLMLVMTGCTTSGGGKGSYPPGLAPDDVAKLISNDPMAEAGAREAFMQGGAASVPGLEACATGAGETDLRRAAVRQLGELATVGREAKLPALEALLRIRAKRDAVTEWDAAVAIQSAGPTAIPVLLAHFFAAPDEGQQRVFLISMVGIDRTATVDAFIAKLGNTESPAQESLVVNTLMKLTAQYFEYDPSGTAESRKESCQKWRDWWQAEKAKGPATAPKAP
jgi:hypothetical protein